MFYSNPHEYEDYVHLIRRRESNLSIRWEEAGPIIDTAFNNSRPRMLEHFSALASKHAEAVAKYTWRSLGRDADKVDPTTDLILHANVAVGVGELRLLSTYIEATLKRARGTDTDLSADFPLDQTIKIGQPIRLSRSFDSGTSRSPSYTLDMQAIKEFNLYTVFREFVGAKKGSTIVRMDCPTSLSAFGTYLSDAGYAVHTAFHRFIDLDDAFNAIIP